MYALRALAVVALFVGLSTQTPCYNDAGDTVACSCACTEDPTSHLDCLHPYTDGQPCFCYANLDDPNQGQMGPVGCMKMMPGVGEEICVANGCAFETDPTSGGPEGCYCCSTDC